MNSKFMIQIDIATLTESKQIFVLMSEYCALEGAYILNFLGNTFILIVLRYTEMMNWSI